MRENIAFRTTDGVTLRGWLYRPAVSAAAPLVVMAHGFSAVKEMYLDRYAEAFAAAGIAALVFDNRGFGESDGPLRQEADPQQQIRDYRDAITFAETLPGVDAARLGVWGTSYSGGHVLVVAATDRRVKAVVSQVPLISGHHNMRRLIRADMIAPTQAAFAQDRRARYRGEAPAMIPVVSEDPLGAAVMATADSWTWFSETAAARAPGWRNAVTLRSVEMYTEYEPGAHIAFISPTPLLLLVADNDVVAAGDLATEAYSRAREPKALITLKGGHFDAYTGAGFEMSSRAATEWFVRHL